MCSADLFLGILALLFPPLPVWVKCGICSADSVINILLCFLGVVPGVLHAWYIIAKFPDPDDERADQSERGNGRVTYVLVRDDDPQQQRRTTPRPSGNARSSQPKPPPQQTNMTYGTNANAGSSSAAGPSEGAPPPSYAQAVSGDHKIQDQS